MKITNQIIWITGASSGIGKAFANLLSGKGNTLILSSRTQETLLAVKESCSNPKESTFVVPMDLSNPKSIANAYQEVTKTIGIPDFLLNNAGIGQHGKVVDMPEEVERTLMEVNFFGTVTLTKLLLPHFLERGRGRIAVINSIVGKMGMSHLAAYSASKFALQGYFESLRAELYGTGIEIHLIYPGFINTKVTLNSLTSSGKTLNVNSPAQEKGMAPEVLALKAIKKMEGGAQSFMIGKTEIYAVYLKGVFPRLFYALLRKMSKKE